TLGPNHPATLTQLGNLADTYIRLGRAAQALPLAQRAVRKTRETLGSDYPTLVDLLVITARAWSALGYDVVALVQEALKIAEIPPSSDRVDAEVTIADGFRFLGWPAYVTPDEKRVRQRRRA